MFGHADIWRALDSLARLHGCSSSALARLAGLDPTAFNPSKRTTADGRPRWPSTESLAKVLDATGTSLTSFAALVEPVLSQRHGSPCTDTLPCLDLDRIRRDIPFDDEGMPSGQDWDVQPFPIAEDPHCFAIEITTPALPPFRPGDRVIVSPAAARAQAVRRDDLLMIGLADGEILAATLIRQSPRRLDVLLPTTPPSATTPSSAAAQPPSSAQHTLDRLAIRWMGRILWTSR